MKPCRFWRLGRVCTIIWMGRQFLWRRGDWQDRLPLVALEIVRYCNEPCVLAIVLGPPEIHVGIGRKPCP